MSDVEDVKPKVDYNVKTRFNGPLNPTTPQEAGRKGGLASGAAKRNKVSIRETMRELLKDGFQLTKLEDLQKVMEEYMQKGDLKSALAIRGLQHAFAGHAETFNSMVDNIEGRLANTNVNATLELDENENARRADDVKRDLLKGIISDSAIERALGEAKPLH